MIAFASALFLTLAGEPGWEWRAAAGAEINPASHGDFSAGVRNGPWSIEFLTDTLDLRYAAPHTSGRHWVGLRGELIAAGLISSPWTAGAPDPARARGAGYAGADAGWYVYFGPGLYAGVSAWIREYFLYGLSSTTVPVADPSLVVAPSLVLGWWSEHGRVEVTGGGDFGVEHGREAGVLRSSPRIAVAAELRPRWILAPRIELRAGAAEDQDDLTRTRLGGLNPYSVPLAGAGWGEWWVEDYAAVRAGPCLSGELGEISLVVDAATFDGGSAFGLAALGKLRLPWLSIEGSLGFAPEIPRQPGVSRLSAWIKLSREWSPF
ncbi:MAG: hypothetical protein IT384_23790 [Deltaproteobacteria bacterium]|nr:hypothetical protein [Deltaproteobacteria bacterium]